MMDEKNMSAETQWYYEKLAYKAAKAFRDNNFEAEYVPDRSAALAKVKELIPAGGTVGWGDSVTLHQIGLIEWLKQQKEHEVFSPFNVERSKFPDTESYHNERFSQGRKALTADVFCTGTNAITIDGKLVNIDGNGNRVAAMIYGPGRVVVVSGFNKIVKDVDEAIRRIKEYASPVNMKRHVDKHGSDFIAKFPCYLTGTCQNCRNENKACRVTTIIDGWSPIVKSSNNFPHFIVIVGEFLGI